MLLLIKQGKQQIGSREPLWHTSCKYCTKNVYMYNLRGLWAQSVIIMEQKIGDKKTVI